MKKNKKSRNKEFYDIDNQESDEYFYYIAGYTSNGTPFGITWEKAGEEGLVKNDSSTNEIEDMPF